MEDKLDKRLKKIITLLHLVHLGALSNKSTMINSMKQQNTANAEMLLWLVFILIITVMANSAIAIFPYDPSIIKFVFGMIAVLVVIAGAMAVRFWLSIRDAEKAYKGMEKAINNFLEVMEQDIEDDK